MGGFDEEWKLLVQAGAWLTDRGYRLVQSHGPGGMEQGAHVYLGESVGIGFLADRGHWSIELRPGPTTGDWYGEKDWFGLECWSLCLGAPVVFHYSRRLVIVPEREWMDESAASGRLRPQLEYLRVHLTSIEEACHPTRVQQTTRCLTEYTEPILEELRTFLRELLLRWQSGEVDRSFVRDAARARSSTLPGDRPIDACGPSSIPLEVLDEACRLDIAPITKDDVPAYLRLLDTPPGGEKEAWEEWGARP